MTPAVEVVDLVKRYPAATGYRDAIRRSRPAPGADTARPALGGVSLEIAPGELFGLLGQNGAGKTTLIRILTTALRPTSGTARVAGHDVERDTMAVRRSIGLISGEERSFYWRMTGRQNLVFFAAIAHIPLRQRTARIEELLERVSLTADADRPVRTYSTGMRQRLGIARGLLSEPEVLFMDEPTRSLDPISARDVRILVKDHVMSDPKRAVILATHSMAEAEALCDRVAFVRRGEIVAAGPLAELRRTLHPGIRCELVLRGHPAGAANALRAAVPLVDIAVDDTDDDQHIRIILDEASGALNQVLRAIMVAGAEILDCRTSEASLEEIFVRTLGADASTTPESLAS
jgi:ABC-2 type transport system ATP-binding protein